MDVDGNYRPDLKGLRQKVDDFSHLDDFKDGNYRPDLKGLRLFCLPHYRYTFQSMEITDLI